MSEINWVQDSQGDEDFAIIWTPIAKFGIFSIGNVLVKAEWVLDGRKARQPKTEFLAHVVKQINRFWQGYTVFFPIDMLRQGTIFRIKVLDELCRIPVGETRTYADLAAELGSSPRAIGGACRNNPFPLLIPCHRVVSKSGFGGYAGKTDGELLGIKQKLLVFEESRFQ
jgi:methylated-DNA-[protein]-cysteine S-methyltransferase